VNYSKLKSSVDTSHCGLGKAENKAGEEIAQLLNPAQVDVRAGIS
jgi:hypothetical protein